MYNKQEVNTVRGFAQATILHMEQLVKSLNTMDALAEENQNLRAMADGFSVDLQAAQARIGEDEATIQFKDNQLKAAESELASLKLDNDTLKQENERKSASLKTYEQVITDLKKQGVNEDERGQTESGTGENK